MHHYTFRKIFIGTGTLVLFSVVVLWSFNALSDLFGGPQAQYKHAIAATGLLLVIKWGLNRFRADCSQNQINHRHRRRSKDNAYEH